MSVLLAAIPAGLWWHGLTAEYWPRAGGRVLTSAIQLTHYNAEVSGAKVRVTYQYEVDGGMFTGEWAGFWPEAGSPNAMAPRQVERQLREGASLIVLYNPANPAQSDLHHPDGARQVLYSALLIFGLAVAVFYCRRIYPAWRKS